MKVAIVKYNAGNTASVANALARLGIEPLITDDAAVLTGADKVIFPGVGEASTAMRYLRERGLDNVITSLTQPVLGICLGMQLLCTSSEENDTECLGVMPYQVRKFQSTSLKIPHVGWNTVEGLGSTLFNGITGGEHVYFVHGYYVEMGEKTTATCNYVEKFSAAFENRNFYGVQFHPERSGNAGQRILENFLKI